MPTFKSNIATGTMGQCDPEQRFGPFKSSSGDFYVLTIADGSAVVKAWKASSVTGSWTSQGNSAAFGQVVTGATAVQWGDDLICFFNGSEGTSKEELDETTFDMSADSWDASWSVVDDATNYWASSSETVSAVLSNGSTTELVVFYGGPAFRDMGQSYDQPWITNRTSAGAWDTPTLISAGSEARHVGYGVVVVGSAEWVHAFYREAASPFEHNARSYRPSDNTTSSIISLDTTDYGTTTVYQSGCGYDVSGTWEIRVLMADLAADDLNVSNCYEDGSDHVTERTTASHEITDPVELTSLEIAVIRYDPFNKRELVLFTEDHNSDSGANYVTRPASSSPGTFGAATLFDTSSNWSRVHGEIITRDGGTFFDGLRVHTIGSHNVEYWEIDKLNFVSLPPNTQQQVMSHPNLRR
jgi:hypothetical protein